MPESKFRLLFCLMSHSKEFKIKASYLRKRFSPKTISLYMGELVAEGLHQHRKVALDSGGFENLHHVNPVDDWGKSSHIDECSVGTVPLGTVPLGTVPLGTPLMKLRVTETKGNQTNPTPPTLSERSAAGVKGDGIRLKSELALKFHDKTPGAHIATLLEDLLDKAKGSQEERRRRVLACIRSMPDATTIYNGKSRSFWLIRMSTFDLPPRSG